MVSSLNTCVGPDHPITVRSQVLRILLKSCPFRFALFSAASMSWTESLDAETFLGEGSSLVEDKSRDLACEVDSGRRDAENLEIFEPIDGKDYAT